MINVSISRKSVVSAPQPAQPACQVPIIKMLFSIYAGGDGDGGGGGRGVGTPTKCIAQSYIYALLKVTFP